MGFFVELLIAFLVVGGALWTVVVGVALMRQRDALSRINAMGPATALGLPMPKLIMVMPSAVALGMGRSRPTTVAPVRRLKWSR